MDALDGMVPKSPRVDPTEVKMQFENQADGLVDSYWVDDKDTLVHVGSIEVGNNLLLTTHNGHKFVFKDTESKVSVGAHTVLRDDGEKQTHVIGGHEEF